jgi:hypothetical protein
VLLNPKHTHTGHTLTTVKQVRSVGAVLSRADEKFAQRHWCQTFLSSRGKAAFLLTCDKKRIHTGLLATTASARRSSVCKVAITYHSILSRGRVDGYPDVRRRAARGPCVDLTPRAVSAESDGNHVATWTCVAELSGAGDEPRSSGHGTRPAPFCAGRSSPSAHDSTNTLDRPPACRSYARGGAECLHQLT